MTPSSPYTIHSPNIPSSPNQTSRTTSIPDFFSLGPSVMEKRGGEDGMRQTLYDAGAPLSPFHYQLRKVSPSRLWMMSSLTPQAWRVPYLEEKIHETFRTHIYGWVSVEV